MDMGLGKTFRGISGSEFVEMSNIINEAVPKARETDMNTWILDEDGIFMVKQLKELVDEKILGDQGVLLETKWNDMIPRKVNIFIWRLRQKRILVRVVLDQVGIDLDTLFCPCCNDVVESIDHYFIRSIWVTRGRNRILQWWDGDNVVWGSVDKALTDEGCNNLKISQKLLRQAVVWATIYGSLVTKLCLTALKRQIMIYELR